MQFILKGLIVTIPVSTVTIDYFLFPVCEKGTAVMTNVQNICNLIGREEYNVDRIKLWYCTLNNVLFSPKKKKTTTTIDFHGKKVYKIKK